VEKIILIYIEIVQKKNVALGFFDWSHCL